MSMSEFEQPERNEEESSPLPLQKPAVPEDFTDEDVAFATELNALFSPEKESLPPYYIQTLLDVEDQRFEPVARGFEYKTSARVFRRLKLRRRLFGSHTTPFGALSMSMGDMFLRRSALTAVGTFALIMLLTVAFTGSSFASGVAILLRGTQTVGAYQVTQFPPTNVVHHSHNNRQNISDTVSKQIPLLAAQHQLHFPLYWPEYIPSSYALEHVNFYVGLDQQWVDGPMLEFEYYKSFPAANSSGTGQIWVREFKPRMDVLQLVEDGASTPIDMDGSGRALAIYVNGQWNSDNSGAATWVSGGRSELIYQADGVVFWIVGDQRDGIKEKQLMDIALGLTPDLPPQHLHTLQNWLPVSQMSEDAPGPFAEDVIIVIPSDSGDGSGSYYISVSSYQPPKNAH